MSYNRQLFTLRKEKNLTIKEAAKQMGVPAFFLALYERGVYKPPKRYLKRISDFYGQEISLEGLDSYPTPVLEQIRYKYDPKKFKRRAIITGVLTALTAIQCIVGALLFNTSIKNESSFYGNTYQSLRRKAQEQGTQNTEVLTGLEYYTLGTDTEDYSIDLNFYSQTTPLYFNESIYSGSAWDADLLSQRYIFQFGGNLLVSSYACDLIYQSPSSGVSASARFIYNGSTIDQLVSMDIYGDMAGVMNEGYLLSFINAHIDEAIERFSALMSSKLGETIDFYQDFLAAREQGRLKNANYQKYGVSLLFFGIIVFFISGGIFTVVIVNERNYHHRHKTERMLDEKKKPLPKDIRVPFGIPHRLAVFLSGQLVAVSFIFIFLGLFSKIGLKLPEVFGTTAFANTWQQINIGAIFFTHLVTLAASKNARVIGVQFAFDLFLFLFVASLETSVFVIMDGWGYDVGSLASSFLPVNVIGLCLSLTAVSFLLFTQPKFIADKKTVIHVFWRMLAIIPAALAFLFIRIGASYVLDYGVEKNIYINIWFPTGYSLFVFAVLLSLLVVFIFRDICKVRFGQGGAQIYFYGDRYALYETIIMSSFLIVAGIIDICLRNNQYARYLGIGANYWYFGLAILLPLIKYEPLTQQNYSVISNSEDALSI